MIKEGMLTLSILSTLLGSNSIQLKEPLRQEVEVSSTYNRTTELDKISQKVGFEVSDVTLIEFKCTYYTSLPSENGGYTVTCEGKPLEGNIVANNTLPLGTKILINNTVYTVKDKGSSRFRKITRLDILVERNQGESDEEYLNRVNNLGVEYIEGYIIK